MQIFLDESGDLGWSFDKPNRKGGSSRFITIAGIIVDKHQMKFLVRHLHDLLRKYNLDSYIETKGSSFSNAASSSIVRDLLEYHGASSFEIVSITANKQNARSSIRRDKTVFYNHMLNVLVTGIIQKHGDVNIVLDNRTIRLGSRNSFEDCIGAKLWGELGFDANISCRYQDSKRSPCIWLADWISNFIWRHYEYSMSEAYLECSAHNQRYFEKHLFM
jgi:hypothetical protein